MASDEQELITLASSFYDECIAAEEMARLESLLEREDLRRTFIEFSNVHYALKIVTLSESDKSLAEKLREVHQAIIPDGTPHSRRPSAKPAAPQSLKKAGERAVGPHSARVSSRHLPFLKHLVWAVPALAAGILLVLLLVPRDRDPQHVALPAGAPPPPDNAVAHVPVPRPEIKQPADSGGFVARILSVTEDAAWKIDGEAADFLMRLKSGDQIELARGLMKIEFSGRAEVILHAPAELQIGGPSSARLFAGYLTGKSSDGSFSLRTPAAEVIDVGTEFGVSVDGEANTNVSVFEGEVHVGPMPTELLPKSLYKLSRGMSARVDHRGYIRSDAAIDTSGFPRKLPQDASPTLGTSEMSLIDVISGSGVGEYRLAGSIDPSTGYWGEPPWDEPLGVEPRSGSGRFVAAEWNPLVDGVFVPGAAAGFVQVNSDGDTIKLPKNCGATWGPIWARRRLDEARDPLAEMLDRDEQGFWGSGTVTALVDRLRGAGDGLVGLYPNVGVTIDLQAVRDQRGQAVRRMRGIIAHLERSHESSPLYPNALADFRVYVDGEVRYERLQFRRADGDAQFGVEIYEDDRFLTFVASDSDGRNDFDHTVLIDPVLELAR